MYRRCWYFREKLADALIIFAISGIKLPKDIIIEELTVQQIEDLYHITFEEVDNNHCIVQIPLIILPMALGTSNSPHYQYRWLRPVSYFKEPKLEKLDECIEAIWSLAYKLKNQYLMEDDDSIAETFSDINLKRPYSRVIEARMLPWIESTIK